MIYEIPKKYFFRIHHIRPRFKDDVENVLFFLGNEIARLEPNEKLAIKEELNEIISLYPGNNTKKKKTINNWRTEITALFGLIEYNGDMAIPGRMAKKLSENQDLIEFFRYFLFYFQYPGGHLKPKETLEYIIQGVRFKPASYILSVLKEGQNLVHKGKFGITKAEATHCIFNDLRVTRDSRSPRKTAELILSNRKAKLEYDNSGDVVRYAGDILDYMELADLVKLRPNYQFYINNINLEAIHAFITSSENFFPSYDGFYKKGGDFNLTDVVNTQESWFSYVNNQLNSSIFQANIFSIFEDINNVTVDEEKDITFIKQMLNKIQKNIESEKGIKSKEIGDIGESIVIEHEKKRLMALNREDILHLIKKIPETYAVGYDISSYDGLGDIRRFIEVKTTISRGKLASKSFHMTPSEWSAASTMRKNYYIYRLMISSSGANLFLIDDPVGKYKKDLLDMVVREGADIRYSEKSGRWEPLMV